MDKELFNDLVDACQDAIEFERGNLQLRTAVIELPDEDIEASQLLWDKIIKLSGTGRRKAIQYVDELLRA